MGPKAALLSPELRAREQRLSSLKSLAGRMAHDFNNYLVPLLGYISLIKEEIAPGSSATQHLNVLEESARRTESLLETMLLALRPQRRCSPAPLDLKNVAEEEISQFRASMPPGFAIEITWELESAPMTADRTHWVEVFRHLFSNARHALALGGKLKVSLKRTELRPEMVNQLGVGSADVYEIEVRDNGIGMPAADLERAFDPFFSTRPKGQATGLGLTIVHSVVQMHGGQVLLESREDYGTSVRVWVPAAGIAVKEHRRGDRQGHPKKVRHGKVLLVEDDPLVREVIKTYLHRVPVEVVMAHDGVEALKTFRRMQSELALVLTDITMPNMDGVELCVKIQEVDPNARVVLMSGNVAAIQETSLERLGQERPALLRKPFTLRQFLEVIRAELGR